MPTTKPGTLKSPRRIDVLIDETDYQFLRAAQGDRSLASLIREAIGLLRLHAANTTRWENP